MVDVGRFPLGIAFDPPPKPEIICTGGCGRDISSEKWVYITETESYGNNQLGYSVIGKPICKNCLKKWLNN